MEDKEEAPCDEPEKPFTQALQCILGSDKPGREVHPLGHQFLTQKRNFAAWGAVAELSDRGEGERITAPTVLAPFLP